MKQVLAGLFLLFQAAAAVAADPAAVPAPVSRALNAPSLVTSLLPFGLIFVIFYFLLIAPQRKQQQETDKMIAGLKKGDRVVTSGGLHGTIVDFKEADKAVVLEVAQNVRVTYDRKAIGAVRREAVPPPAPKV